MEFIDLKKQYSTYKEEIDEAIFQVVGKADYILGNEVEIFEKNIAEFVGRKYAVACSDGTAALQLIYMAYNIGSNDAIFCPDMTFIASVEPACLMGATPIFCDIDKTSYNLDVVSLEKQIKKVLEEGKLRPKAIVAVDFVGNPIDYDEIKMVADRYKLLLIEDAAQGIGASYRGRKCGSFGDVSATSFFPSKPLGCYGDGGAVFTDDEETYKLLKSLRVHGKGKTKYDNIQIGINSRLDTIQAAVLDVKLKYLENEIVQRQKVAEKYNDCLKNYVIIPFIQKTSISSYAQYVIILESKKQRDELMEYLKEKNIPTIQYYPNPLHKLPVFSMIENYGEMFKNASWYGECSLGLPFSAFLDEKDQDYIINSIIEKVGK
ncbi:MAG: DegT/DnrJ/EryC1/StrS aminotransferase family protein [Lachnospiraceae bacterium]|nr:DegT/DnrJ/EryC1/StrS aminotransferase family protein [Lachnospiraceae bacterium]